MEIRAQHTYTKDIDSLFKAFGHQPTIQAKLESMRARNIEISQCALTDDSINIVLKRDVPADVPGMLKKFLGEWNTVSQKENWKGTPGQSYEGDFEVAIEGVPVKITGHMSLKPDGNGSTNTVTMKVECGIPLVGKKLAEFVGQNTEKAIAEEYQFLKTYLNA
ncbi:MAG: DUF2505 domain-containing protein [Hahellaceae bacterium]|nr:DUF2505 domain-containing protein [Hahellaceae bacterium]